MRIGVLVVVAACSASPATKQEPKKTNPIPESNQAPPPAAPEDPLNLDFEVIEGGVPKGWTYGRDGQGGVIHGYSLAPDRDAHHGSTSLKVASTAEANGKDFAVAYRTIAADPYRGKHVRLRGWIKSTDVTAPCGMWISVDGGSKGINNMSRDGVKGTTPWHEVSADIDVDQSAATITFGPLLVGTGTIWIDSMSIEEVILRQIVIAGHVVDRDHKPVAHADVALVQGSRVAQHVTTDTAGSFSFNCVEGTWSVSAHHPPEVASFLPASSIHTSTEMLEVVLGAGDATTLHVDVSATQPVPPGVFATVSNFSDFEGDVWAVPVVNGSITAVLPRAAGGHSVRFQGAKLGEVTGSTAIAGGKARVDGKLVATILAAPPESITSYLQDHATALTSPEAGHGFGDMTEIGKMVGDAHIVGLGEATHGTREFFQLKHRFIEYLVAQKGFTVFAIEANLPECRAINDYIKTGKGDAKTALAGVYFWVWNTEEVLAMVEWMRTWNADPTHTRKLEFTGFDMQFSRAAYANIADYLGRIAPNDRDALVAPLAAAASNDTEIAKLSQEERTALAKGIAAIAGYLDAHKADAVRRTSVRQFDDARHDVVVLQQWLADRVATSFAASGQSRDDAMASNVKWLRSQYPAGTKLVLWAHNGHINRRPNWMGAHLAKMFGKDYVPFGFVFGEGSFQARVGTREDKAVGENTVGPAPESDLSTPFTRTGKPLLVVDLRKLPPGPVARWFSGQHPMRDIGAVFYSESTSSLATDVTRDFDALIFVAKTTRARPLPKIEPAKQ